MTDVILRQVSRRYAAGQPAALADVSLHVAAGELLALVGPSGSGKSTLLKLVAGLEQPDTGEILLAGAPAAAIPPQRRGTVLMHQQAYLFPLMSVADNIGFGPRVRGVGRAARARLVGELLALVELPGLERRYPAQLSGGQQQRVALARSLAADPRVLLLDEPLSRLDPGVRAELQAAIRRIQRARQLTTLLVSHDLREALVMADRIALLLDGQLECVAAPAELFERPPTARAARFVGVTAIFSGRLAAGVLGSALGPLRVAAADGPERTATFAIRPERMRLVASPGPNVFAGTIAAATYQGELVELVVAVAGQALVVRDFSQRPPPAPGSVVLLELPAEHLFELAGDRL